MKPIGQLQLGDTVLAISGATGNPFAARVHSRSQRVVPEVIMLRVDSGETIVTTPSQPFINAEGRAIRASELKAGDLLSAESKRTAQVISLQKRARTTIVHDLKLDKASVYLVGNTRLLAAVKTVKATELDRPFIDIPKARAGRPAIGPKPPKVSVKKRKTSRTRKGRL